MSARPPMCKRLDDDYSWADGAEGWACPTRPGRSCTLAVTLHDMTTQGLSGSDYQVLDARARVRARVVPLEVGAPLYPGHIPALTRPRVRNIHALVVAHYSN